MLNPLPRIYPLIDSNRNLKKIFHNYSQCSPQSKIYLRNLLQNKKIYLLKFQTEDVIIEPLYLKERIFEERKIDKCVQPRSKTKFQRKYNLRSKRLCILYKNFELDKRSNRLSIMSSKKPLSKRKTLEPLPQKYKKSISNRFSSIEKSIIYLKYKNIDWELYPNIIDINQSKSIDIETKNMIDKLLKNLGMKSTENIKNRAVFIIRHKKDILKVTFKLSEIVFEVVHERITESVQVFDNNAYFQAFSEITDRSINVPIPKTTYEYTDPMVEIRRRNIAIKLGKMEPRWMNDTRNKRLKEYMSCRVVDQYKDIQELKLGSSLCFEGNDSIHKAKAGTIQCSVDDDDYENWVCSFQKINYSSLEENKDEQNENFPSTFSGTIPDWDLVLHTI